MKRHYIPCGRCIECLGLLTPDSHQCIPCRLRMEYRVLAGDGPSALNIAKDSARFWTTTTLLYGLVVVGMLGLLGCHSPAAPTEQPLAQFKYQGAQRVICESGSEFIEQERMGDPYYVHTMACTMDDANGKPVYVVVID